MRVVLAVWLAFIASVALAASTAERFTSFGGFHLGVGTLTDVQSKLGPANKIESGEAGEYEVRVCYRTKSATVTYLSGEMGGPTHDLLGLSVGQTNTDDSVNCPPWPGAIPVPPPRLAGLYLGMSRRAFAQALGAKVQLDGKVSRAFFESKRKFTPAEYQAMPKEVRELVAKGQTQDYFDVVVTVEGYFANNRLVKFQVWKVETQ